MPKAIVFRDFNDNAICGNISLKRGEEFSIIYFQNDDREYVCLPSGEKIVARYSHNYINYFSLNDDKQGLLRGDLTYKISHTQFTPEQVKILRTSWKQYLLSYTEVTLFSNAFFDAPIEDLQNIIKDLQLEVV